MNIWIIRSTKNNWKSMWTKKKAETAVKFPPSIRLSPLISLCVAGVVEVFMEVPDWPRCIMGNLGNFVPWMQRSKWKTWSTTNRKTMAAEKLQNDTEHLWTSVLIQLNQQTDDVKKNQMAGGKIGIWSIHSIKNDTLYHYIIYIQYII